MLSNRSIERIRRTFVHGLCALALVIAEGNVAVTAAGQEAPGEYDVKAAFVYNFIKFVTWPSGEEPAGGAMQLCILGDLPDAAPFDDIDGQEIMGKRLHIVHLREPLEARNCQALFLSSSLSRRLPDTLELLRGRPVLTIGDTNGYAQRGVMINMYLENKRVRFEINAESAGLAGLRISTKLLSLAGTVYGTERTGK
jgi:hypothetical protein